MSEGVLGILLYRKPPLRRDTDFKGAGMTPDCARISFDMCFDSPLHNLMETVAAGKLLHRFKLKKLQNNHKRMGKPLGLWETSL